MLIQTMCRAFHATPAMDTHASFVHNAGKAGTQHTKPTLLYAFAELRDLAALQHRKIQTQSIAFINLQKRTQALVDSTADMTVQLVLFKCYLDTADKREKASRFVSCFVRFATQTTVIALWHDCASVLLVSCVAISSSTTSLIVRYAAVYSKRDTTPHSDASQAVLTMASSKNQYAKTFSRLMPCL